jgi:hypothetical protein
VGDSSQSTQVDGFVLRETDSIEWAYAVETFEGATIFHETEWLTEFVARRGAMMRWFAVDDAAGLVGVFPLAVRRTPFGNTVNVLPFPYVGPLHRDGHAATMAHLTPRVLSSIRSIKSRMTFGAGLRRTELDADLAAVPQVTPDVTYVVDIGDRTSEDIRKGLNSSARKSLNFALREGLEVRDVSVGTAASVIAALHAQVYTRQGLAPEYSLDDMLALCAAAQDHAIVRASAAFMGDDARAAQIAFFYRGNVYNWVGAAHRDRGVMNVIELETMMWAKSQGAGVVDLVGAPTEGVARFKQAMGAERRTFAVFDSETARYRLGVALRRRLARSGKDAEDSSPE